MSRRRGPPLPNPPERLVGYSDAPPNDAPPRSAYGLHGTQKPSTKLSDDVDDLRSQILANLTEP
jgi:hypothetical protein